MLQRKQDFKYKKKDLKIKEVINKKSRNFKFRITV